MVLRDPNHVVQGTVTPRTGTRLAAALPGLLTAAGFALIAAAPSYGAPAGAPPPGGGTPQINVPWVQPNPGGAGGTTERGTNVGRNADTKSQDPCMVWTEDKGWRRKDNCTSKPK